MVGWARCPGLLPGFTISNTGGCPVNGYGMGMQGWNSGWVWMIGLVVIVAMVLIYRARR
jgi:hypothetical protein